MKSKLWRAGLALLVWASAFLEAAPGTVFAAPTVTVMTRNLYLGADLLPVIASPTPSNVEATYAIVQATEYPARAELIADEIQVALPHLVGLQEAVLWRTQTPGDILLGTTAPNATTVAYDFLQILLDKLAARGLAYEAVAVATNFDVELPGVGRDIRLTDRDVVLARSDLNAATFQATNPQSGNYTAAGVISFPTGPVTIRRGWASVDAQMGSATFRFVNTHLEAFSTMFPGVQEAQAEELLAGPAGTVLPVLLAGDFNSAAAGSGFDTPTYEAILTAGFTDAWSVANPSDPGFTCCQVERLDNTTSQLSARIDLLLFKGAFVVLVAQRLGHNLQTATAVVAWPSDHAGVKSDLDTGPIQPPPAPVPGLSNTGLVVMGMLLLGTFAYGVRRYGRRFT